MARRSGLMLAVVAAAGMLAACGDDSSSSATTTAATTAAATTGAATTKAAPTTAAAATTSASATTATTAATTGATTTKAAAAGAPTSVEVVLKEWSIEAPTKIKAGTIEFVVKNAGTANHELDIVKGDSYAALPKSDSGAILEDKLPAGALQPVVGRFAANATAKGTVTVTPGKYVLVCNIAFGANSHAGKGQRLDIEVTA